MEWREGRARMAGAMFATLRPALARLPADRWPTHAELDALAGGVCTARGMPVRFVPPRELSGDERLAYESHIARTGEVPTRPASWHDLFNALAWITWPRAKARINAQHVAILEARGAAELRRRSPARDALTLFDEGGVVVASADRELLALVEAFEWKALFWHRRDDVLAKMRFFAFGHGAFEQGLAPYIGMVAKTVFVPAERAFLALPLEGQVARADALLDAHFADPARFASPKAMAPLPLLGIPGWHFAAQDEAFYDDARYFRSRPRGDRRAPPAL